MSCLPNRMRLKHRLRQWFGLLIIVGVVIGIVQYLGILDLGLAGLTAHQGENSVMRKFTATTDIHGDRIKDKFLQANTSSTKAADRQNHNSHLQPRYHKIYPGVNCSAIFAGDVNAIQTAESLLSILRNAEGLIPIPSDVEVSNWVQNCTEFKHLRGYPEQAFSSEESRYPIAYSIVVYRDSVQVERLLRAIYQPQNIYCIHIDKKSPDHFHRAIRNLAGCLENVFIASKLESVKWGEFSALLADRNCMRDLLEQPVQWKYVLNLCGMDFPLKTNLEIVRQLKAYRQHNCIESINLKYPKLLQISTKTHTKKLPAPHNITVYKGDTYIAATRAFVNFTVNDQVANDFRLWLSDHHIPDEYFTSSLNRLPYAPGGSIKPSGTECNVRFRKWSTGKFSERPKCIGKWVHWLCVFEVGYLRHLRTTSELFLNKLHYNFDPLTMQCMETFLDHRTHNPDEFKEWAHFPVTNFSWLEGI